MHRNRKLIVAAYVVIDVALISLSLYLPYFFRYNPGLVFKFLPYFKDAVLLFVVWGGVLLALLNARGLYATNRALTIPQESRRVFACVVFASVVAGLMIFILQVKLFSRLVFFQSFMLLWVSLSLWRIAKRLWIRRRLAQGLSTRNVLIVGAGRAGTILANEVEKHPYLGLKVAGFFDTHKAESAAGYTVLGRDISLFGQILQKHYIDEVYITIPSERVLVSKLITVCQSMKKSVSVIADNFTLPFYHLELGHMGIMPVIKYMESKQHGTDFLVKRIIDIAVSALGLVVLAPVFAMIAVMITRDTPGPVLYTSLRCGKKGRVFKFYKFRSMVDGADTQKESLRDQSEVKGPVFKMKDDPRITKMGRFLRGYSLDELPQLFNVLKGDMSLVGPRPPTPEEVKEYDVWQMRRLDVRPGITCLWQVRGRSNLSFYKWVRWDLWYIDNWSFGLDFKILLWTIPSVLKRKGAY